MQVSGVPILEQQHDEKYGDDPRYVKEDALMRGGVFFMLADM